MKGDVEVDIPSSASAVSVNAVLQQSSQRPKKSLGGAKPNLWTLVSGRKISFTEITVPAEDVETLTYVNELNRRIQEEVSTRSLAGSIKRQQYQSCIAQLIDGRYLILDGSRRRQAAIEANRPLRVLFCVEELTLPEVKGLSKESQSSEEHSLRDNGKHFEYLLKHPDFPMTVEQVLEEEGINKSFYDRCVRAWAVPSELIALFETPTDLGDESFRKLTRVAKKFPNKMNLVKFISKLEIKSGTSIPETLNFIEEAAGLKKVANGDKPRKIVDINKNRHVKVKKSGKSKTVFEVSNGSQKELEDIERLIADYYKNKQDK